MHIKIILEQSVHSWRILEELSLSHL